MKSPFNILTDVARCRFSWMMTVCASVTVFAGGVLCCAAGNDERSIIVPVRTQTVAAPPQTEMMPLNLPQAPVLEPTLPSGRLPQYDLSSRAVEVDDRSEEGALRYRLASPGTPLLLEVVFLIDGQPYQKLREQLVQDVMEAWKSSPNSEPVATASTATVSDDDSPLVAPRLDTEATESTLSSRTPGVEAALQHVRKYAESVGREPTAEEIDWLLTHRVLGPTLLPLRQPFQSFRADQRPVFTILDRDRDNVLSKAEILGAVKSFQDCDLNRDDIVDVLEINKVAADPRLRSGNPLPVVELLTRVSSDSGEPDLKVVVSIDLKEPSQSTMSVTAADRIAIRDFVARRGETVLVALNACNLEITTVQSSASDQVAVGAVNDGYPLLPVLDLHDDGKFTVRELRTVVERLQQADADRDGAITLDELKPTIRLCFGLGPIVHSELVGIRSVNPRGPAAPNRGPDWFVRMDRNGDLDLTRQEFPGTDEQFRNLDADSDGLISADEASMSDENTTKPKSDTTTVPMNADG